MSASEQSQQVIASLKATFATNCCVTATLALYVYDRIVNFNQEVDVVWMRRKTLVTALFGCMHFFSFSYLLLGTLLSFYAGPCEMIVDHYIHHYRGYSIYVSYVAVSAALYITFGLVAALRVYAINGRNWRVPAVILVLSLLGPATDVVHCLFTYRTAAPPPVGCVIALSDEDSRITRVGWSTNLKVSLTSLLLRDVCSLSQHPQRHVVANERVQQHDGVFKRSCHRQILNHPSLPLFLNLRKTALNPNDSTTAQTSHVSDIRFTSALGNFGSAVAGSSTQYTERDNTLEWFEPDSETYELSDSHAGLDSTGSKPEATSVSLASGSRGPLAV
ncbi:uncharacterized protein B0H18DRAFT_950527 [Fomitopsis serialis]|uniref:uncharacterized protein n=1 Tax=Fomitopsis serialis TaxID=139415 RepID=UPI002007E8CB|nr:uncharacterized protein B0H18DRAFT_950527 [Neoantrodia serialis]KAH9936134.1 hypothetical protein B0H18DRAFT_950527 [Neoantrodia serialis]